MVVSPIRGRTPARRRCETNCAQPSATAPGGAVDAGRCDRKRDYTLFGDATTAPLAGEVAAGPHAPLGMIYGSEITACGGKQTLSLRSLEPDCRALWVMLIVMRRELRALGDRVDLPAQCLDPPPRVGAQLGQGAKKSVVIHSVKDSPMGRTTMVANATVAELLSTGAHDSRQKRPL